MTFNILVKHFTRLNESNRFLDNIEHQIKTKIKMQKLPALATFVPLAVVKHIYATIKILFYQS